MPKRKADPDLGLPSKQQILAFMAAETAAARADAPVGKIGKREIARAFNVTGDARMGLKRLLRDMEAEGTIAKRGKRVGAAGALPTMMVVDVVRRDRDGDLLAKPTDWEPDQ